VTAVSAVIFLVSARHSRATVYIFGRVEAGEKIWLGESEQLG
jgi:iron(III) transport system permease protein